MHARTYARRMEYLKQARITVLLVTIEENA